MERNHHLEQQQTGDQTNKETTGNNSEDKPTTLSLNLPYAGVKGDKLISKVKKFVANTVNKKKKKVSVCLVYKGTTIGSKFNIKDQIKFEHLHNVVYHTEYPNHECISRYNGQRRCRIAKRVAEHRGKDNKSHLFIHANETKHKIVNVNDFNIIGKGYRFMKKLKPNLNIQKDSYKLSLFN